MEKVSSLDWESRSAVQQERLDVQTHTLSSNAYGYRSLYRYATATERLMIVCCSFTAMAAGAAMPLMTVVFGNLSGEFVSRADSLTSQGDFQHVLREYTLYFVYLGLGSLVCVAVTFTGFSYIGERLTDKIRQNYFRSVLRQNIAFFDHMGAGELIGYMTTNMNMIQDGISQKIGLTISGLSSFVCALIIAFVRSWRLALVLLSVVAAILLAMGGLGKVMKRFQTQALEASAAGGILVEEALSSVRTVTALGAQGHLETQFVTGAKRSDQLEFWWRATLGLLVAVMMGINVTQYGLGFWQGHRFLNQGQITLSQLLTTILAATTAGVSFGHIVPHLGSFSAAASAAKKVFETIDRESPIDPELAGGIIPPTIAGELSFQNVTHWYPARQGGPPVLRHFNLHIAAGRTTALVGASGSGKSTLVSLLARFYLPVDGKIQLDEYDIESLNLKWLRHRISIVSQEPVLFSTTIAENILYGLASSERDMLNGEIRRKRVIEAAKIANAHDFISRLPQGYETVVGERGMLLSGGQRQRIAIARALVSDPKILLLDEATASLDSASEQAVQTALDSASFGRTTIVIAHRLSTVQKADRIVVMYSGEVVEQGTHAELMSLEGSYYTLFQAQQTDKIDPKLQRGLPTSMHEQAHDSISDGNTLKEQQSSHDSVNKQARSGIWDLIRFVWVLNEPEVSLMLAGFVCAALGGLVYPALGILFGNGVFALTSPTSGGRDINFWAAMFLTLGVIAVIVYFLQGSIFAMTAARLIQRSRKQAFSSILRQDISFFERDAGSSSLLVTFITADIQDLAGISGSTLGAILNCLWTLAGAIIISCSFGWKLALVCTSAMPFLLLCGFLRTWIITRMEYRLKQTTTASALACEAIPAMRTVASFNLQETLLRLYQTQLSKQARQYVRDLLTSSVLYALTQSIPLFATGLAFWYGGTLIATGEYTVKQFFICFISVIWGSQAAAGLFSYSNEIGRAQQAGDRLKTLLERAPPIDTWSSDGQAKVLEGDIHFDNVHFAYPARPEQPVLRGVSLSVRPGQFIAIVGPSGSGKSTLIALLERFYDTSTGTITVDGLEIRQYNIQKYRAQIGLVDQQTMLYQGTIRDNIAAGWPAATEDGIIQACRDANIYDFIMSLPDGLATVVGAHGFLLSGGQRQRLAIARALLRQPQILLLDEATSALDTESERAVQEALERASHGRTTIAIAHRLSTIQHADRIFVMDSGRVVEQGTHRDLMELKGTYWQLACANSSPLTKG